MPERFLDLDLPESPYGTAAEEYVAFFQDLKTPNGKQVFSEVVYDIPLKPPTEEQCPQLVILYAEDTVYAQKPMNGLVPFESFPNLRFFITVQSAQWQGVMNQLHKLMRYTLMKAGEVEFTPSVGRWSVDQRQTIVDRYTRNYVDGTKLSAGYYAREVSFRLLVDARLT